MGVGGWCAFPLTPPFFLDTIFNASSFASTNGFTEIETSINFTTVHLTGECFDVSFDVTPDQAYSIARGLERSIGARPLTHDIMKDMLDIFGIETLQIRIDRFRDDIYYATIVMHSNGRVLELDARPSDAIALATRTGSKLFMRSDILQANGEYIC